MNISRKALAYIIGGIVFLLAAWFSWAFIRDNFLTDSAFREAQWEVGEEKVLIYDMRAYFHGRAGYDALSFDDLHRRGILDDDTYHFVTEAGYWYYPFSPKTPDNAVVLKYGSILPHWLPPLFTETLHKGDFTAGPQDGDIVIK